MEYLQFRKQWINVGCFSIYQVRAWNSNFDRSNLTRWVKKDYLCKLRQDWYAFCELKNEPDMAKYIAAKIYTPSYISLHSALSFYGIIPETVTTLTCVTSNRTTAYTNPFGHYTYQTIKPKLFFGYRQILIPSGGSFLIAEPEKAIVDLLYLYPQYNTQDSFIQLRFDQWWMQESLDTEKINLYAQRTNIKSLQNRIQSLINTYTND